MYRALFSALAAFATAAVLALPAAAQVTGRDVLRLISQELANTTTLEAQFVQLNADGSRSDGVLSLHRPGRMRMAYSGDNAPLVIVGGSQIALFDSPRKTSPEVYPLQRTPLWLVLQPNPQLHNGEGVEKVWADESRYYVTTYDPNTPEAGRITFQFRAQPLALEGWVSQTSGGETVTVALTSVRKGVDMGASLFSATHEANRRSQR